MGINLTWVCHVHKKYHTSMRGEEGVDFQHFVREAGKCPKECFKRGNITVYHDGYFDNYEYDEFFPEWEDRPAEREQNVTRGT